MRQTTSKMKSLTESKFAALVDIPTPPHVREVEWWAAPRNILTGTVVLDLIDNDWSWVILGRDEVGKFRAIDMQVSLPSQTAARESLLAGMDTHYQTGQEIFPQGDN
jgi:hypothetical protein